MQKFIFTIFISFKPLSNSFNSSFKFASFPMNSIKLKGNLQLTIRSLG